MKLTKRKTSLIIGLTAVSLLGLLLIQVYWLQGGIDLSRLEFKNKMGAINERIVAEIRSDEELMESIGEIAEEEGEYWLFSGYSQYAKVEDQIVSHLQHVLQMHDIGPAWQVQGRVASGGNCWFMGVKNHQETTFQLNRSRNKLCFCPTQGPPVFDLGFDFVVEPFPLSNQLTGLSIASFLFMVILVVSFIWFVLTVFRQKRLSELKTDFINNLTHEFKTPIFSIGLGTKMIKESAAIRGEEKVQAYVDLIERENLRLKNQVDKVLQMAVMDSGNFSLDPELVQFHSLAMRVASSFQTIVEEKRGKLVVDLKAQKQIIFADKTHIANMLYNLLDNAYKYSPEKPEIYLQTVDSKEGIEIRIRDNGIGMSSHIQSLVFDKFFRAENSHLHNIKGFGLGLSYVRKIVEMHKGNIYVRSKPGQGSEFIIHLPYV